MYRLGQPGRGAEGNRGRARIRHGWVRDHYERSVRVLSQYPLENFQFYRLPGIQADDGEGMRVLRERLQRLPGICCRVHYVAVCFEFFLDDATKHRVAVDNHDSLIWHRILDPYERIHDLLDLVHARVQTHF